MKHSLRWTWGSPAPGQAWKILNLAWTEPKAVYTVRLAVARWTQGTLSCVPHLVHFGTLHSMCSAATSVCLVPNASVSLVTDPRIT